MKKRILCLTVMFLFILSTICFANMTTPANFGAAVDNNLIVRGVNIDSPAYNAGIRPNDKIEKIAVDGKILTTTADILKEIYRDKEKTLTVIYSRNGNFNQVDILKRKIKDPTEKATFLIAGNSDEIYNKLITALSFDKNISPYFPIQSVNKDLKMVQTYSLLPKKTKPDISDYTTGSNGFGIVSLETLGNIVVSESQPDGTLLIKVNLQFKKNISSLFGNFVMEATSNGILERNVILALYE